MDALADPRPTDLDPRAQTALVVLRRGGLTVRGLSARIADASPDETRPLLAEMQRIGLIAPIGDVWYLDDAGVSWLARRGLPVPHKHTRTSAEADPEITLC